MRYTVYSSGDVLIDTWLTCLDNLPPLPRLGLQMQLPEQFDRLTWFGRGPHENYPDRKESALMGLYSSPIKDLYVPYILPQEYGNRSDVLWAVLSNMQGLGILAAPALGTGGLNVSAHEYTTEMLTQARHTYELKPSGSTVLNIDYLQSGLGSNSCGPGPLQKYRIESQDYHFTIYLRHFSWDLHDPAPCWDHADQSALGQSHRNNPRSPMPFAHFARPAAK
jgi:hypothetical protein